ncbi:DNA/RNA non-specific endonuclease [Rhizobacter sp. Root1221]|uniref:DNA/RNA non-specific endonuclease n=1 Tax=Rhizobacter sp. Root1221 TaxID=1736433 RepID=UPI000AFA47FF|nr:DNA/RNA non-specific endonuclease [Rhizobacter sp. Root1221]
MKVNDTVPERSSRNPVAVPDGLVGIASSPAWTGRAQGLVQANIDSSPRIQAQSRGICAAYGARGQLARSHGGGGGAPQTKSGNCNPLQLYGANYGPLSDDNGSEVKTDVIAPNDTAGGSNVTSWPNWWPMGSAETANDFLRENFVQGHLLNQKLGGPGDARKNLTPLTRSTNSQMSHSIENIAKGYLSQGYGIEYWVTASYNYHPSVSGVGGSHLPQGEKQKLQTELDKMAGEVGAQITVHQGGAGKWKVLPKPQQPKDVYVKNEGAALKGSFT